MTAATPAPASLPTDVATDPVPSTDAQVFSAINQAALKIHREERKLDRVEQERKALQPIVQEAKALALEIRKAYGRHAEFLERVGEVSFDQIGRALRLFYAFDLPAVTRREYEGIMAKFSTSDLDRVEALAASVRSETDIEIPNYSLRLTGRIKAIVAAGRSQVDDIERSIANLRGAVHTLAQKMQAAANDPATATEIAAVKAFTPHLPGDDDPPRLGTVAAPSEVNGWQERA